MEWLRQTPIERAGHSARVGVVCRGLAYMVAPTDVIPLVRGHR